MRFWHRLLILSLLIALCTPRPAQAAIFNGDFEQADPNDPNNPLGFLPPTGWQRENYAAVLSHFVPNPERGSTANWKIDPQTGLDPYQGSSFVVLSTGDVKPDPYSARIWQQIQVAPGLVLSGAYFFGTCDYTPYDDVATIRLLPDPNSQLPEITLVSIAVSNVGSYGSMAGWASFQYVFQPQDACIYNLVLDITDILDNILKSYLAVDALTLCPAPQFGDLNNDCRIDTLDFAGLANDWLHQCHDPNNGPCADLTGDQFVDLKDLSVLTEHWLIGE
jgi:hypothetical protein